MIVLIIKPWAHLRFSTCTDQVISSELFYDKSPKRVARVGVYLLRLQHFSLMNILQHQRFFKIL